MSTERNITATITRKSYTALVFDNQTHETRTETFTLTDRVADEDALKVLRKRKESADLNICAVLSIDSTESKYAMSELDFIKYGTEVKEGEKIKGRNITRTITRKSYTALVFDNQTHETRTETFTLTDRVADEDALKALRKRFEGDAVNICAVLSIDSTESKYALPELDFIKYGTEVKSAE